jgi:hypothetical protein
LSTRNRSSTAKSCRWLSSGSPICSILSLSAVDGDRVLAEHEQPGLARLSLDRAVALHPHDAVDDGEAAGGEGGVQVEDAVVDALPVEGVFGPAVDGSGDDAEEVLHGERDPCPVVSLELGHRDEEVGVEHGARQVEVAQVGKAALQGRAAHAIHVEVHVGCPDVAQGVVEARREQHVLGVAAVAGALGDDHLACVQAAEGLGGCSHQQGVGVDDAARVVFDQVRLEDHTRSAHGELAGAQSREHGVHQALVVGGGRQDGDARVPGLARGHAVEARGRLRLLSTARA